LALRGQRKTSGHIDYTLPKRQAPSSIAMKMPAHLLCFDTLICPFVSSLLRKILCDDSIFTAEHLALPSLATFQNSS
jgi:hypothetical protein